MQFEGEFDISSNHVATKYNLTKSFQKLTAFHNEKWLTNYDCNRKKKQDLRSFILLTQLLVLSQMIKISEKFSYVISEVNLNCPSGTSDQMASGFDTLNA